MYKTRLRINKPVIISFVITIATAMVFFMCVGILIPSLLIVYKTTPTVTSKTIDTKSVNEAIELLNK